MLSCPDEDSGLNPAAYLKGEGQNRPKQLANALAIEKGGWGSGEGKEKGLPHEITSNISLLAFNSVNATGATGALPCWSASASKASQQPCEVGR